MSMQEPEPITSVDKIPWDLDDPYEATYPAMIVFPLVESEEYKEVAAEIPKVVGILWNRPSGPTVAEWLPGHIKTLDANARLYDLTKGEDHIPDEFFERYKDILEPAAKVEAQLLILFRLALHQTQGTIGSEIQEAILTKVERRNAVVAALVLGDVVFIHVSPAVGDNLDIEEISHQLFKQIIEKGDELMILRASRSTRKISEAIE